MKTTGQKIKDRRETLGLTQKELADEAKLSIRTVNAYEADSVKPRGINIKRICHILKVSEAYLMDPDIEDPEYGMETSEYVDTVRSRYGSRGAMDVQSLLEANRTYFAGGDVPSEDKDLFFNAVMEAYMASRQEASARFTPNKFRKNGDGDK